MTGQLNKSEYSAVLRRYPEVDPHLAAVHYISDALETKIVRSLYVVSCSFAVLAPH